MLIGIVKKNGIMMVDFAVERRRAGKTPVEAVHEPASERFRPIIMTTLAALMGAIPIAIGFGADGGFPLALGLDCSRWPGRLSINRPLCDSGTLPLYERAAKESQRCLCQAGNIPTRQQSDWAPAR